MEFSNDSTRKLMSAVEHLKHTIFKFSPLPTLNTGDFHLMRHVALYCAQFQDSGEPGIRLSALAKLLRNAPPTVSQRVSDLENGGYLERIHSKRDRRVVYIALTEKGRAIMQESMKNCDAMLARVTARLGDARTDEFIAILGEFADAFEAEQQALDSCVTAL